MNVYFRILRFRQQPGPFLKVEVLAMLQAKSQEVIVSRKPCKMEDQLLRSPSKGRIVTQTIRPKPVGGDRAVGNYLFANGVIDRKVFVSEELQQRQSLALRQFLRRNRGSVHQAHASERQ